MTEWPLAPLDDLCDRITVGHVGPMADKYVDEGVPFLRSQNILPFRITTDNIKFIPQSFHEKLRKSALRPGDVAVVRTGYPGTAAVVPEWLSDANCADLVVITPGGDLDAFFLASVFNSTWGIASVGGRLVGAAQQHFNVGAARRMELHVPPLLIQRKIAAILSAYDDLIENNNRRIKILDEMAQRIYREWFVNFRYPGHEDIPLVESEWGPLPEGWSIAALSDLATVTMGQSPPSSAYNGDRIGLPFHQGVGTYGEHFPRHEVYSTAGARLAYDGDILVSVRAPVGRINVADRQLILGRGLCGISARVTPNGFLLYALRHVFREEDSMGNGAIFKSVTKRDMSAVESVWPGIATAEQFSGVAEPMWSEIRLLTQSTISARETRDLLLPRLISGEVDVTDLDVVCWDIAG